MYKETDFNRYHAKQNKLINEYLCYVIHDRYLKLHVHERFIRIRDPVIQNVLKKGRDR